MRKPLFETRCSLLPTNSRPAKPYDLVTFLLFTPLQTISSRRLSVFIMFPGSPSTQQGIIRRRVCVPCLPLVACTATVTHYITSASQDILFVSLLIILLSSFVLSQSDPYVSRGINA